MQIIQNRRTFLAGLSAAGAAGLYHISPSNAAGEPPPETTTVRLPRWVDGAYCWAGAYVAGELLHAEGLTDVRYVEADAKVDSSVWIARGATDFDINFPPIHIASIDAGVPVKVLTGLHSGCLELIATENIRNVSDLRGKRVGVTGAGSSSYLHVALMAAYVGLDPMKDIQWTTEGNPGKLFREGKIDAFLGTPPEPQQLRAQKIGHTILNTTTDQPWSQYFCCMSSATADYVDKYPVATKRILRAIFKAADLCASSPQLAAQQLVDRGFVPEYRYALETLNDIRYDRWREYDAEDALRFYALQMQEVGFIKAGPKKIIADGTDWRFLNELKRELKT